MAGTARTGGELRALRRRMLRRGLRADRGVSASLVLVLALSAMLMATGTLVVERLLAASGELAEQSRPPHLLQMHAGEYDPQALEDFAREHPEIDAWFVEDLVGVDGAAVSWSRSADGADGTMADTLIDLLWVTQNPEFDHLVDADGTVVESVPGTVHVPVAIAARYDLAEGDVLRIDTGSGPLELTVAGTVRDGQMASSLSSSTRFLVSPEDWATLAAGETTSSEIIVEYRLHDEVAIPALQRAYEADPDLPRTGQAVTIALIRLITVVSDAAVALALIAVSLVLMAIAVLALRLVLRGALEDEARRIGVLRAIGLPGRTVAGLHLARFRVLSLLGCGIGALLSVGAAALLTGRIGAGSAQAPVGPLTVLLPVLAVLLVHLMVMLLSRGALRAAERTPVLDLLVHGRLAGSGAGRRRPRLPGRSARRSRLTGARGARVNVRLALIALRAEGRRWLLLPMVFALGTLVVTVPVALWSTVASPQVVTYLGVPDRDLRSDIRFSEDVAATTDEVVRAMEATDGVTAISVHGSVLRQIEGAEGWRTQAIDVGDQRGDGIRYVEGSAPAPGEIALSVLAAETYDVQVGDEITLRDGGEGSPTSTPVVRGIYQDVTDGGVTAAMQGEPPADAEAYTVYADVEEGRSVPAIAQALSGQVPAATTLPLDDYVEQTFASLSGALRTTALLAGALGLGVSLLLTTLFLRLHLVRERSRSGVLRALGLSREAVAGHMRLRVALGVLAGVAAGSLAGALLGPPVVGVVLSVAGLGLPAFAFLTPTVLTWVALPLGMALAGYLAAHVITRGDRAPDLSTWLRG